eukprot:scaffold2156_cov115-Cylindrotheca_fusiformis.AAC.4
MRLHTYLLVLIGLSIAASFVALYRFQASILLLHEQALWLLLLEEQDDGTPSSSLIASCGGGGGVNHVKSNVRIEESSFRLTVFNHTHTYRYPQELFQATTSSTSSTTVLRSGQRGGGRRRHLGRSVQTPSILFAILSTPDHKEARNAIRESWGRGEHLLFLVAANGSSCSDDDHHHLSLLDEEMAIFQDTIVLKADEDYRTGLTRKTMLAIHFLVHHLCNNKDNDDENETIASSCLDYLFKTDDDSYVNTTQLRWELLQPAPNSPNNNDAIARRRIDYYGEPSLKTEPDRNTSSRFYISKEDYPARYYPNYAFGMGYALSYKLAICAAAEMQRVRKQPPWEDVATGVLARRCRIRLTQAHWMISGMKTPDEVQLFPYDILRMGGVDVTVVHGIKRPEWMLPVHRKEPLFLFAKNNIGKNTSVAR